MCMQVDMYRQLLQHLIPQQAAYPVGFESWEQCVEEDEEEFYRFRYTHARMREI